MLLKIIKPASDRFYVCCVYTEPVHTAVGSIHCCNFSGSQFGDMYQEPFPATRQADVGQVQGDGADKGHQPTWLKSFSCHPITTSSSSSSSGRCPPA